MSDHDGFSIVAVLVGLALIGLVIYIAVILATVFLAVAAGGGTIYGGGAAIRNYCKSFKENVIDSNKGTALAA